MTDEEKKAIEILKDNIGILEGKLTVKYTNYNTVKAYNIILNLIEKLQKENENLKSENSRLKVIRYSREYGTENIYLIPKSDLVQIDINKYMIEIEDGKFVDLKQIYQENKELEKEKEKNKKLENELKGITKKYMEAESVKFWYNYIHKDKIRKMLQELEDRRNKQPVIKTEEINNL